jgi:uncharacterized phage-like protein YoqJ
MSRKLNADTFLIVFDDFKNTNKKFTSQPKQLIKSDGKYNIYQTKEKSRVSNRNIITVESKTKKYDINPKEISGTVKQFFKQYVNQGHKDFKIFTKISNADRYRTFNVDAYDGSMVNYDTDKNTSLT